MYGQAKGIEHEARRLHHERFLNCRLPFHPTCTSVGRRLLEIGFLAILDKGMRHPRTVWAPEAEEHISD